MTRILFASNTSAFLKSHRFELVEECMRRGWEVHLAAPDAESTDFQFQTSVTRHTLALERYGTNVGAELAAVVRFARQLRAIKPDLLHNFTMKAITIGSAAAALSNVPAVVNSVTGLGQASAHNPDGRSLALRVALEGIRFWPRTSYVCQNAADALQIRARVPRGHAVVEVLGSGVNLDRFEFVECEPPGEVTFALASRLLANKGVRVFAEAARALREQGVSARFLLAGGFDFGHPTAISRAEIEEWSQARTLEYVGEVQDMPTFFKNATIAVLPSLGGEGVPKFLLEAIASGTPFITTDVPGCLELAEASGAGTWVPRDRPDALASEMARLASSPTLRARLRANCLRFRPQVDVGLIVATHFALYAAALGRR